MSEPSGFPDAPVRLPTDTLIDSVFILLALSVVQRLVGFFRAVFFCRWLDAEQLGLWDMAFNFLVLAAPLAVLAIPGAFGRYLEHYRQRGQLRAFLRRMTLVCAALALVSCVNILLFRQTIASIIFGDAGQSELVATAAASLMIVIAYNFAIEWFTALRNIRLVSVMQLINSVAFAVLGFVLLLSWRTSAQSVVLAYGGSCLIALVWASGSLRRIGATAPSGDSSLPNAVLWTRVAPFAAWILLGSVLTNLFGMADRYMIVHFSSTSAEESLDMVGNYHSSRVVPLLLVSLAAMLATMILPHLSHDWEAGRRERVAPRLRLFLKLFGIAMYAAAVLVLLASPLLFGVAFRGKFPEGQAVLPWALVYSLWFSLSLVAQCYLLCAEKARLISAALGAGLLLNVLFNVVLLPRFGLHGAVLATTAANALLLGLVCWLNHRLGFRLDGGAKLILGLPLLLSLGPWAAVGGLLAVVVGAVWGCRLLSPEEKRIFEEGLADFVRRFGFGRWRRLPGRRIASP